MARTTGLGPTSGAAQGQAPGGVKMPGIRLGKMGKGGAMNPGTALFVLVLLEIGVQVVFRRYFKRAHGG